MAYARKEMQYMFRGVKWSTINLKSFNTSNVTWMRGMFNQATNLTTIYVSNNFVTTSVTTSDDLF